VRREAARKRRLVNAESPPYDELPASEGGRQEPMNNPSVIVCERSGIWATSLARHLGPEIRLRQTRGLEECVRQLAAAPASLLALEVSRGNLPGGLALLVDVGRRFPASRSIVLAERGCERYEWLLREAGAVHFSVSPRESESLARLAVRHFGLATVPLADECRGDVTSQIWDALPWNDVA
jgi:hypothetical protein